jgi:hypothetical protein
MKTAIITGASSGMGREFAKEISRRYVNIEEIWVIARREEKLLELKEEIKGKEVVALPLDLTREEDLIRYQEILEERAPEVCILVNCAGYGKIGTFEEVGYEQNRGMVKLNCQALTDVTYMTLPFLRARGRIIQLASSAAFVAQPNFAVYAATKAYVLSFSRALRVELREREIVVTAVCPGPVKTEFFDVAQKESGKSLFWMKRLTMAKPEKVVKQALKDSHEGREKSVYGIWMKLFEILCKVLPHKIIFRFM